MNPPKIPDLKLDRTLFQDLEQFQKFMSEFSETITDPANKQLFTGLLKELEDTRREAEALAPGVVKDLQADVEKAKTETEEMQRDIAKKREELDQAEKELDRMAKEPPSAPAPEPEPAVAAGLAAILGNELLGRFGRKAAASPGPLGDLGSVASHWEDAEPDAEKEKKTAAPKSAFDPNESVIEEDASNPPKKSARPTQRARPDADDDNWNTGFTDVE